MNVACSSCPAKYAVPDEKVRGRKVRITCKRCGAAIIVDGTGLGAGGASDAAPAAPDASAGGAEAPAAAAPRAEAAPAAAPSAVHGEAAAAPTAAVAETSGKAESDVATTIGAAPSEAAWSDGAAAAAPAAPASPTNDAKTASAAKASTGKPLGAVAKVGEAKAGAFPKPGAGAGAGAAKAPLGGAPKVASAVAAAAGGGKAAGIAATPGKAATAAIGATAAKAGTLGGVGATGPVAGTAARGAGSAQAARAVLPRLAGAAAPAVAPNPLPERTWTVAVTDDDHHEMTLAQIVEAYAAQKIDAETFIWRDGMQDWLMPFEIGEIATALRARRLVPRTNAAGAEGASLGAEPPPGAWREPGRWDRDAGPAEEPSFDDVTVAMEAPKAKALLQAVSTEEAAKAGEADAAGHRPKPSASKSDEPTMIAPKADEPTTVQAQLTAAALGFDEDDGPKLAPPPAESITAIAESLEREPERLPFELAPSAAAPRAALKSGTNEAEPAKPRDLFARRAPEDDAAAAPEAANDGDGEAGAKALTGARNESSVLFSLDQLTKPGAKPAAPSTPKKKDEAALLLGDAPAAAPVTGLGGGALFGSTNMAAPDFTAPPPPSVPPPAPKATSAAPGAAAKPSRGAGIWIGVVVALAAVGAAAYFLSRSPAAPESAPAAVPTAAETVTATATATPSAAEPAAAASAAPEATASASASASAAPAGSAAAAPAVSATTPTGSAPAATTAAPAQPKPTQPGSAATPKPTATAEATAAEGLEFNKDAAMATLATAAANSESQCASEEGPHGTGKVTVTFANSGRATNALVSGDFAGSALGGCIARIFRGAKVPAFGGDSVRVSKTVRIP